MIFYPDFRIFEKALRPVAREANERIREAELGLILDTERAELRLVGN